MNINLLNIAGLFASILVHLQYQSKTPLRETALQCDILKHTDLFLAGQRDQTATDYLNQHCPTDKTVDKAIEACDANEYTKLKAIGASNPDKDKHFHQHCRNEMNDYLNWQDHNGNTALHMAARNCDNEMINAIEKAGANKDLKNNNGDTHTDILNRQCR